MKANTIDDYNKRIKEHNGEPSANTGLTGGNNGEDKPTDDKSSTQTYYDLARQQEYGTLFDKEVQLENAKAQALKYTQNQINAQGFGGTGYGSSLQAGTYNTYLNKLGEAQSEYAQNIKMIDAEEKANLDAEANDRFESITTMLTQASTQEQMDNLLANYGYGEIVDGKFTWGEKPEGMSDDDWYQIKYYYGLQSDALSQGNNVGAEFSLDGSTFMYSDEDGSNYRTMNNGDDLTQELNATYMGVATGQIPSGSYIHLESKEGKHMYIKYENGKFYYISKSDYDNADDDVSFYCFGRDTMQQGKGN